jgi:hypothetical protein
MKSKITNYQKYYIISFIFFVFSVSLNGKDDLKSMSDYLNHIIDNKEQFAEQKGREITSLKNLLEKKGSSLEYEYEINLKLYNEYKKFKLDSAIHYAERNMQIAEIQENEVLKYNSQINLASAYSYSGKFLESQKILNTLNSKDIPKELLPQYYETFSRFYEHYAAVSNQNKYYQQVEIYRDSLLSVLEPSSFQYKINIAHKYITQRNTEKATEILNDLLETESIDSPEYALITHYLGSIYGMKGNSELEKKYYTMSAIADIKNSIKENASFQQLALIYYEDGDISKAFKYTQSAIEDAVFSGVQFRTAEMSEFYSIINASYQVTEAKTNSQLKTYLVLISILSLFLILLVIYVYKQMKKLSRVKEELSGTNEKLIGLNEKIKGTNALLNERNTELWESNHIKEQYIAQFFNLCSAYIDKMEDYRKNLYKLGINRQFDDLMKRLKSNSAVESELEDLYRHFDMVFLSLYPTFVDDFNALLADDEQITLKSEDLMNRELRIFALLRLGINDNVKISGFLRCSMSTIYNYRTKMRNRAGTNRDDFEQLVMKIGTINSKKN